MITPTPGRIVEYILSESDVEFLSDEDRAYVRRHVATGNQPRAGESYPMVIVRAWGDTPQSAVNGQVLLDGNDTYWVTSRYQTGTTRVLEGTWRAYPGV